jgi:uncharacterized damage-inducible protein DinB
MEISNVSAFLTYYGKIRERTERLIKVIPPETLNFTYLTGKFTIADQIRHIAKIERYMFAETIAGRESAYQGCSGDPGDKYEDIIGCFHVLHQESLGIFESLNEVDLDRICITPGNARISVRKWLRAMVEHEIHHRAQLYLYLNILGVSTPPIFGLTAEQVEEGSIKIKR